MTADLSFHALDYVTMVLFLMVVSAIGIYYGFVKKQTTTEEYLVGGRRLHLLPVSLSLFVTYQSAVSVLGIPTEVYLYNTMHLYLIGAMMIAHMFQAYVIVPLVYPLKLTSTYEYLGRRFDSRSVQLLGMTIGMLHTILYICIVLLAPAMALESVANIPLWLSVIVVGIIGTFYTSIGGIRTVVVTDVFRCVFLFIGLIVILILCAVKAGGVKITFEVATDGERINFHEWSLDPRVRHTVLSLLIGGFFSWLPICCSQANVQRICSMRSARDAKISALITIPLLFLFGVILVLTGVLLYSYFTMEKCDPWASGSIDNPNQLVPYLVMRVFNNVPGLSGLFIAVLLSGTLSALSSGINSMSANTVQDILVNILKHSTELRKTLIAKIFVIVYGVLAVAGAYFARHIASPVTQATMVISGGVGGPMVGILFLGAIFPQANWIGALIGGIISISMNIWLAVCSIMYGNKAPLSKPVPTSGCAFPSRIYANDSISTSRMVDTLSNTTTQLMEIEEARDHLSLYDVSYLYLGLLGFLVCIICGLMVSLMTGTGRNNVPKSEYILPCMRTFWKVEKTVSREPEKCNDAEHMDTRLWNESLSSNGLNVSRDIPTGWVKLETS